MEGLNAGAGNGGSFQEVLAPLRSCGPLPRIHGRAIVVHHLSRAGAVAGTVVHTKGVSELPVRSLRGRELETNIQLRPNSVTGLLTKNKQLYVRYE